MEGGGLGKVAAMVILLLGPFFLDEAEASVFFAPVTPVSGLSNCLDDFGVLCIESESVKVS